MIPMKAGIQVGQQGVALVHNCAQPIGHGFLLRCREQLVSLVPGAIVLLPHRVGHEPHVQAHLGRESAQGSPVQQFGLLASRTSGDQSSPANDAFTSCRRYCSNE